MHLVFFTHPAFLHHQSMPRFARLLANGMRDRGHTVEVWCPQPRFSRLPLPQGLKKWFGYIDQYLVFAQQVPQRVQQCAADTLFVFTDQALGPWVPLVADRPHVIHCHDFLAQRSARGEILENPTGWTGRQYQAFIRRGYSQGKNFISVSQHTRDDLQELLPSPPVLSEVVLNGFNQPFTFLDPVQAQASLSQVIKLDLRAGYLLHVGGNQWYKNRLGVVEIYNAWRAAGGAKLPLLLIGEAPVPGLRHTCRASPFSGQIHLLSGLPDEVVRLAYAGATVFLFPSLAEGFGWPIAEAMASGCPVITTNQAPMTEVAGSAGFLIPRRPRNAAAIAAWAMEAAATLEEVVTLPAEKRRLVVDAGLVNATRFHPAAALDRIEEIYQSIIGWNPVLWQQSEH
jgi:glycosyltransferase involved in cell wall biosynthesis